MRFASIGLVLVLMSTVLVGCGGGEAAPAPVEEEVGDAYASDVLDASYDGALGAAAQLALGTIQLEETEEVVTPEQAAALLPLWQALQGGVTARAEVNALMKQIEGTMAAGQLEAIAAMQLTQEDMRVWMQGHGLGMGGGQGQGRPGGGGGEALTEDERATRRAEFSGGGDGEMPPEVATRRAEFENMSDEEREALRATMEAGGGASGGFGRSGRGAGQFGALLNPLIELLTLRVAE